MWVSWIRKNKELLKINSGFYSALSIIVFVLPFLAIEPAVAASPVAIASKSYVDERVPAGGAIGQVLKKTATGNEWMPDDNDNNFQDKITGNAGKVPVIGTTDGTWGAAREIANAVTAGSNDLVTSGAVDTAINTAINGVFIEEQNESAALITSTSHPNTLVYIVGP
jgi:hypothetical protein